MPTAPIRAVFHRALAGILPDETEIQAIRKGFGPAQALG